MGTSSNPEGGIPDCGIVSGAESAGRAPVVYSTRNLRASKPAKEDTQAHKKMRQTEVEKLKKDHNDTKKQRAVRGCKAQPEKNKEANIDSQQNAKGKRKRNMNAPVSEDVSVGSHGFSEVFVMKAPMIRSRLTLVLCVIYLYR